MPGTELARTEQPTVELVEEGAGADIQTLIASLHHSISQNTKRMDSFDELRKLDVSEQMVRHERVGETIESLAKRMVILFGQVHKTATDLDRRVKALEAK